MDESAQRLHDWLLKRSSSSKAGRVRAAEIIQAAADRLGMDLIETRSAFRILRSAGELEYSPDIAGLPYSGYITIKATVTVESPSATAWRCALQGAAVDAELQQALMPAHALFSDLQYDDRILVAKALARIRRATKHDAAFGFSLSAQQVLGSSKILDRLPAPARRLLGISELPATPRYVVVAGPVAPEAVLLIENTTTYEEAIRAGLGENLALIVAYGYGLNLMTDSSAGWALVESLSSGRCEVLCRTGRKHQLPVLLRHPRLFFWGDLDREGLRIALALRSKLRHLELSALYEPMRVMIKRPETSHPYSFVCGKANQQPWRNIGDACFDSMARACENRAVDQEAVDVRSCRQLAAHGIGQQF